MRNYRIYLIRHGATKANDEGIYIGRTDYELSEKGISELYEKLDIYDYPNCDVVYTSPLKRCTETAEILYPDTKTVTVNDLQEAYLGEFEGERFDKLLELDSYKSWLKGGKDAAPPDGESNSEVMARAFKALHFIITDMMDREIFNAAVITHAGIIMDVLNGFCLPKVKEGSVKIPFGEGFELYATASSWARSQVCELHGIVPFDRTKNDDV